MKSFLDEISKLRKTSISKKVNKKLKEFKNFKNKDEWFSEMCFCLLTANSKAKTALNIQDELGVDGFIKAKEIEIRNCIKRNKHRFHNNKARYIVEARSSCNIKDLLKNKSSRDAREFLVKNIKGLGYKEASHFLRNVGYFDLAILDRHILNLMVEDKIIRNKPKTLNKKVYFEIENKFKDLAKKLKMSCAELDLYMWYIKTKDIIK
ncbi:MAG: N-glycosylase/DNA lyase [Candidatus Nanoarchaeia archaeon]|nr:N-glycosylase/DNA lyase [Candidatus Nanoarchaeia archaeon]